MYTRILPTHQELGAVKSLVFFHYGCPRCRWTGPQSVGCQRPKPRISKTGTWFGASGVKCSKASLLSILIKLGLKHRKQHVWLIHPLMLPSIIGISVASYGNPCNQQSPWFSSINCKEKPYRRNPNCLEQRRKTHHRAVYILLAMYKLYILN